MPDPASDAERSARDIREMCLRADADAGLALCDLLLDNARRREDEGRPIGSMDLPPCAWKVLVRLMEGWAGLRERCGEQHAKSEGLRHELDNYRKCHAARSEKSGRRRRLELVGQLYRTGYTNPGKIHAILKSEHGIDRTPKTIQNDLTGLRREGKLGPARG
jgi:hypothetical protein